MNKTIKRSVVISAVLTIALCASLIVGATFALFTSESQVNIAVTSGKVDVVASIENLKLYSAETVSKTQATNYLEVTQFTNGGTATLDEDGNLTLDKMTPGDRATFTINVANNSNVSAIYRTSISVSNDTGLYEALEITVGGTAMTTRKTAWENIDFENKQYNVVIDLPASATAQDAKCTLTFTVEAMQGNAVTNDITAAELAAILKNPVDGVVTLEKDYDVIDDWTSLKFSGALQDQYKLNGNGHTISGLTMPLLGANAAANIEISNLTIADSNIGSIQYSTENSYSYHSGAFVAAMISGPKSLVLNNCHANNVNVVGSEGPASSAGSLVGYTYMTGADDIYGVRSISISDCTVTGGSVKNNYGNAAGIVGMCATSTYTDSEDNACSYIIDNCSVNGCKIQGEAENKTGEIVGTVNNGGMLYITDCTYTGNAFGRIVSANLTIDDTVYCQSAYLNNILASGTLTDIENENYYKTSTVTLDKNYVLLDAWTPFKYGFYGENNVKNVKNLIINGDNHTISGLTATLIEFVKGTTTLTINNLTISDANINGGNYQNGIGNGCFVAYVEGNSSVTLDGCNVINSKISDGDYHVAALIGAAYSQEITVNNCAITNVIVESESNAAGVVGYTQVTANISNVTFTNLTLSGEKPEKEGIYVATVTSGSTINLIGIAQADGQIGRILAGTVNYNVQNQD